MRLVIALAVWSFTLGLFVVGAVSAAAAAVGDVTPVQYLTSIADVTSDGTGEREIAVPPARMQHISIPDNERPYQSSLAVNLYDSMVRVLCDDPDGCDVVIYGGVVSRAIVCVASAAGRVRFINGARLTAPESVNLHGLSEGDCFHASMIGAGKYVVTSVAVNSVPFRVNRPLLSVQNYGEEVLRVNPGGGVVASMRGAVTTDHAVLSAAAFVAALLLAAAAWTLRRARQALAEARAAGRSMGAAPTTREACKTCGHAKDVHGGARAIGSACTLHNCSCTHFVCGACSAWGCDCRGAP